MKNDAQNQVINNKLYINKKVAGFNLIELMAVLIIIAIITLVGVKLKGKAEETQSSQQMIGDVNIMTSAVKNKFGSADDNYSTLSTTTAINMNINNGTSVKVSGTALKSQFSGGTVTLTGDATNGQTFDITYTLVPTEVCQQVIAGVGGTSFQKITAGGTTVYDSIAGIKIIPATTATACGKNANVTMVFTAG